MGLRRRKRHAPHTAEASAVAGEFARSQKRGGARSAGKQPSPATGDAEEAKADAVEGNNRKMPTTCDYCGKRAGHNARS
eukprot:407056-Pleurochrysis_carterae.AAC.1